MERIERRGRPVPNDKNGIVNRVESLPTLKIQLKENVSQEANREHVNAIWQLARKDKRADAHPKRQLNANPDMGNLVR
jgi:hypothetical protein